MSRKSTSIWYLRSYLFMVYVVLILLLLLRRCTTEPEQPFVPPAPPVPVLPEPRPQPGPRPQPEPEPQPDPRLEPTDDPRRHGGMGKLKITLMWDFYGDIDLHVKEPSGNTIKYNNKVSSSGGRLDIDKTTGGRGTVENIYWQRTPPSGEYKVYLNFYSKVSKQPSSGRCRVYVYVDGELVGRYDQMMTQHKEKHLITTIRVP